MHQVGVLEAGSTRSYRLWPSRPRQASPWHTILGVLLIFSQRVAPQKTSAACMPEWSWLNNREGDSPCSIAAQLLALCATRPASFELGIGRVYTPSIDSTVSLTPNTCSCNIVTYNLLMACSACQKGSSPSNIPTWAEYGKTCSICSTETGISPGPCGQQTNAGFPSSVHPQKGKIGVPLWAFDNTSGAKWNPAVARKLAAEGGQKTIESPSFANEDKTSASDSSAKPQNASGGKQQMRGAVIACSCLAGIILICFSLYLLRLWLTKRKERRIREFGDSAFDKVVPTASERDSAPRTNAGCTTPMKLNFRSIVGRLTIALPKTPGFPKTPKTPGQAEKMPSTPLTARFWTFGKRDTKKLSMISQGDESEYLEEKSVRFEPVSKRTLRPQRALSKRCDSVASNYSDFDSYKSATSQNTTPRPGSIASVASSGSRETLTTGIVKVDRPKLREAKRVDSMRPTSSSVPPEPFRRRSQASTDSHDKSTGQSKSLPAVRIRSQSVKVDEWTDRASLLSQESRKSAKSRTSRSSAKGPVPRGRSASTGEIDTGGLRDSIVSERDSSRARDTKRRTKSTGSRSRLNRGTSSDYEGSLSDSEQRETIHFPDELKEEQRDASERYSAVSSVASSTMDKSTGRIQELFKSATENLRGPTEQIPECTEGEDGHDEMSDAIKRASGVTVSSNSSNMRRLDSVIGQLEFDEMMLTYGSPTKKSWFARLSTKSGKSVPPPSPAFSSAPGLAM